MKKIQKITPNLWFDDQVEQAAQFYTSIFKHSKMGKFTYYRKDGHEIHGQKEGSVMTVEFQIEGQEFVELNGGLHFNFSEAISFIVNCETQEEVDYYWENLSESGDPNAQHYGWLKDKFGVSWQIVPTILTEMIKDPDQKKTTRVLQAMYPMKKLDIELLCRAFEGS